VLYRVGEWATFKESLLARLSSADVPALAGLGTRSDTDFTIALCDSLAITLDVLSFYQERIANENYLRTATERGSVLELCRLIGYEPSPGCAASSSLAFTLQESSGVTAVDTVTIPVGTRVQSVPGQDETAQSFETVDEVDARVEWNAIPVRTLADWIPAFGDRGLYLQGVGLSLVVGDVILIVGQERLASGTSANWDIRVLESVELDTTNNRTHVTWNAGLGNASTHVEPAQHGVHVYVFRQRAGLFGHNAPDPTLLTSIKGLPVTNGDWTNLDVSTANVVDLDAAYPKVVRGSWFVLAADSDRYEIQAHLAGESKKEKDDLKSADAIDPSGLGEFVELFEAGTVAYPSRSGFGLSGKVTRISPSSGDLSPFRKLRTLRSILVLAQPEELPPAGRPIEGPLYGDAIDLSRKVEGLVTERSYAVSGRRARVGLRSGCESIALALEDGTSAVIDEGTSYRLAAPPEESISGAFQALDSDGFAGLIAKADPSILRLTVLDDADRRGVCTGAAAVFELVVATDDDEIVSEVVTGTDPDSETSAEPTVLQLGAALENVYERASTTVCANVAPATHGESVTEILGSGNSRQPNATFELKSSPLTYVSSDSDSGRSSTLEVRVNDLEWKEVDSLYGSAPGDRVYEVTIDDDAVATVRFGDGIEGARPPSGDHNVRAQYRKGIGLAGNVAAGTITTLLSRPLGVSGATNPQAATGGEDPDTLDRARGNAPLGVLTLQRAVSIRDYESYARNFGGIAKAHALWIPSGPGRGVFLTVAGEEGAEVMSDSDTFVNLLTSLHDHGDPMMPVRLVSYRSPRFQVKVAVKVADDADAAIVLPEVEERLRTAFAFDVREFGQGVTVDELSAVAQAGIGIVAVQVSQLRRVGSTQPSAARLFAELPVASPDRLPLPAELLTLDEDSLVVEVMP